MSMLSRRIAELCRPMMPAPTGVAPLLSAMAGIKAVLFDIYGTLLTCERGEMAADRWRNGASALDALRDAGWIVASERAGERAMAMLEHSIKTEHERMKSAGSEYPEVDIREMWESVLRSLESERLVAAGAGAGGAPRKPAIERLAVEYECRVNPVWPMPSHCELLAALRGRGITMGVVSNAQFYTPLLFEALPGTDWSFFERDIIILSFELREAKPSPRLLRTALDNLKGRHKCLPSETLFVGNDMLNDIAPASRMGCKTALFAGDARSLRLRRDLASCSAIAPDAVITSLIQLLDVVSEVG